MSLHHVGIEIAPADLERSVELFALLGFEQVAPPPSLADRATWLRREGTEVHLMHADEPVAPPRGHLALIVADFEPTLERLRAHGFPVEPRHPHWGAPRALTEAPGGHRIELMQSPP